MQVPPLAGCGRAGVEGPSLMHDGVAMPVSFGAPILHAGQMMPPEYTPYKEKENV